MAQLCGQGVGLLGAQQVFLAFRPLMPFLFRHAGLLGEVAFPEPVGAHDVQGHFPAGRLATAAPLLERNEAVLFKLLQQIRRPAGPDLQGTGNAVQRGPAPRGFVLEDVLEDVLLLRAGGQLRA